LYAENSFKYLSINGYEGAYLSNNYFYSKFLFSNTTLGSITGATQTAVTFISDDIDGFIFLNAEFIEYVFFLLYFDSFIQFV